ncbi:MAG: hypothetical protein HOJ34_05720 [Kordiimonadaceae bacterium]|jgi:tetratricopeptide (TPR) repeat protein|nr:hypothetical protein [Kordiimonadaceae bacterium]MBT6329263.1 hypothetical protein [Kordiimonadaceae bacterium]MBT7582738.1 hypothetical protein [Kordiimonadaceae bacterium]
MNKFLVGISCSLTLLLTACGDDKIPDEITADDTAAAIGPTFDLLSTPVGTVNFPNSCNAQAAPLVARGVALMHHMMFDEAKFVFSIADDKDPNCAMAYWGQSMALIHPLWPDPVTPENYQRGLEWVKKAQSFEGTSEREIDYFKTTEAYFSDGGTLSVKQRYVKMSQIWDDINKKYPDDMDAQAYNALYKIAISNSDEEKLREAASLAFNVLENIPDHPGAHHYVIHAYDTAMLAGLAIETADNYGKIAPRIAHATHMMTHTYTRLGEWNKAITWNTVSSDVALELCIANGEINNHYAHANDYLMYAYLQKGEDAAALQLLTEAHSLNLPFSEDSQNAMAYSYSAMPARYALERRDWDAAVKLEPKTPSSFPWIPTFDPFVANTHYARALAFTHLGRPDEATTDIQVLHDLSISISKNSAYWGTQVKIQELTATAWQHHAKGDMENAMATMKQAATLESTTDKNGVTPGEVSPAAEFYGDMLRQASLYKDALTAYEMALKRAPGRYNSLYGAGMAALAIDDKATAKKYFDLLNSNTVGGNSTRASLAEVREILETL